LGSKFEVDLVEVAVINTGKSQEEEDCLKRVMSLRNSYVEKNESCRECTTEVERELGQEGRLEQNSYRWAW
jgi:hypothetical protein